MRTPQLFRRYLWLIALVFLAGSEACEALSIASAEIPLPAAAVKIRDAGEAGGRARVASYALAAPVEEAVRFYTEFFARNGFLVIGGPSETGFNASVKKGDTLFGLRIWRDNDRTVIQFIW